ncbi:MAG: hypothetical protein KatS3mg102_1205 [Planctomycetota bacterium]|nr:MAG: hypothetical protein KatS3mg102_1205 [Planctomycetota bacterium]
MDREGSPRRPPLRHPGTERPPYPGAAAAAPRPPRGGAAAGSSPAPGSGCPAVRRPARTAEVAERLRALGRPRYADGPPDLMLRELFDGLGNPGRQLAWLAAYGAGPEQRQSAAMLLYIGCGEGALGALRAQRLARAARPVLQAALGDPELLDDVKLALAPLLLVCGGQLREDQLRSCFRDFDAACARLRERAREELTEDVETAERCLVSVGLLARERAREDGDAERAAAGCALLPPPLAAPYQAAAFAPGAEPLEEALALGIALAEDKPRLGALVLGTVAAEAAARRCQRQPIELALEQLGALASGRAAWVLEELCRWPGDLELQLRASHELAACRRRGLPSRPPRTGEFSHGWVSGVDGAGARHLQLYFRTDEGELDGLVLLLEDTVGLADAWAVWREAAGLEQLLRAAAGEALGFAPCTLELARELLAEAWWLHHERDAPPPGRFLLYRPYLGPEPVRPGRRRPQLGAYLLESWVRGPELAEGSEALCEHPVYGALWCGSGEAYEFVARWGRRDPHGVTYLPERAFETFVREIAAAEREVLVRRLAANLEVEAWAGRARRPANRIAARTYLVLAERLVPFYRVPYVRELCRRAVPAIGAELRRRGRGVP